MKRNAAAIFAAHQALPWWSILRADITGRFTDQGGSQLRAGYHPVNLTRLRRGL